MNPDMHAGLPRGVESALALAGLVLLAPVLGVVAVMVAATSRGGVLFRHRRVGRHGRPFDLLKFRTMHAGVSGPVVTRAGDRRVTPLGRVLRRTKIDELPQLWNVVRGELSLVGPRPEAPEYVDASDAAWSDVLQARPGITDPTTLRLRNEEDLLATAGADFESFYRQRLLPYKLRGYREYLAARTWRSDVAVLWLTLAATVRPLRVRPPSPEDIVRSPDSTRG